MLAEAACKNNWSGIIVNGCIRDSDVIETIDIGVFALSSIPIKSVKKGLGDTNVSLNFMGVTFNPGEYVYADQDGIVISKKELKIN
jgi:regulator of ribonuclease activity A